MLLMLQVRHQVLNDKKLQGHPNCQGEHLPRKSGEPGIEISESPRKSRNSKRISFEVREFQLD